MIRELQDIATGKNDRLMLLLPPGSAKSTYTSKLFPAFFLALHPTALIIGASHSQTLADTFSADVQRLVRDNTEALGYGLANEAVDLWRTTQRGMYRAVGTGGSVTGRRADCLLPGTMLMTSRGVEAIEEIVNDFANVLVSSYDESTKRVVFRRVVAAQTKAAERFFRVTTTSGRVVEATGEHRFYTPSGFTCAKDLSPGSVLLRLVWKDHGAAVLHHAGLDETRGDEVLLREGVRRLPVFIQEAAASRTAMRDVRCDGEVQVSRETATVLQQGVRGQSAGDQDHGSEQPRLARWHQHDTGPEPGLVCGEIAGLEPGPMPLRGVRSERQDGRAPHQHDPIGSPAGKPGCAMPALSQEAARCGAFEAERDVVALVERVCDPCVVYDIQVDGTHNFFANGILVSNCVIIDDPLKGAAEADSQTMRDRAWEWYRSDLYTRLLPGGRIVLVTTRWHTDDPAGKLLAEMKDGGDQWRVLSLPAVAEDHDQLGRTPGEALWPEWEGLDALARKRRVVGERAFASLYQQRPTIEGGGIIKSAWWQTHDKVVPEKPAMIVMSIDTAYTAKDSNDPSACTLWWLLSDGHSRSKLLLRYAWRERLEFNALVRHVKLTTEEEKFCPEGVPLLLLIEAKAAGLPLIQELRRRWPTLHVTPVIPKGDKVQRAHAVTSLLEGGKVSAMSVDGEFRPFAQMVVTECEQFPQGLHDDLVDTVTMALRYFRDGGLEFFNEDEPEIAPYRERAALY